MCAVWGRTGHTACDRVAMLLAGVLGSGMLCPPWARGASNQFGGQDRADAAQRMIVLGVQQAIGALPPVSGQAFSYEYDAATDTYTRSTRLGPTALRSTQTIGPGKLSLRVAASYFDLDSTFGPTLYGVAPSDPSVAEPKGVTEFGLTARAKVGILNLAGSYGLTNRIEVTLNMPLVVVDAQAWQTVPVLAGQLHVPPSDVLLAGAETPAALHEKLRLGDYVLRGETFSDWSFDFNDGTSVGVGRISIGGKGVLYADQRLRLAFAPEFFFPSPNEDEFAGSASAAILPRLIGQVSVAPWLKLLADAGYEYDFSEAELRQFVWSTGAAVPLRDWLTFDLGIGGSVFDTPLEWTPDVAHGAPDADFPATTATVLGDNTLGDTFVDFLGGIKFRVAENTIISGAVDVPLNDQGFRPVAFGTVAVEQYFQP